MRFISSVPTDNFHKFKAVLGLIISTFSLLCLVYFKYLSYHLEKAGDLQLASYSATETIEKLNCRLKALNKGNIEECPFDLNLKDGSSREIESLIFRKAVQESQIAEYQRHADIAKPLVGNINWVVANHLDDIFGGIAGIGLAMFVLGFRDWRFKVQKIADEASEIDLELKKLELRTKNLELSKLEIEVAKLQKPERYKVARRYGCSTFNN